jgi:acyl carrier protein
MSAPADDESDEVAERLQELIFHATTPRNRPHGNLRPEEDFVETLSMTSTEIVQFLVDVEKAFDIELPDEDLRRHNFATFEALTHYVERKIQEETGR